VKRHNRLLFRVARGILHDDSEAEDVVQETYVRAFTHLKGFRGDSALATWLTRIAMNEALGRLRRQRPTTDLAVFEREDHGDRGQVLIFPTPSTANPEEEAARAELRVVLEHAVDDLPDGFRLVFILRDIQGLTTEETATQLSLRLETVKTRLHRARRLLRLAVEKMLAPSFSDLFPFNGKRCANMVDLVIAGLARHAGS
jgi:RNA polymerase sigma-70 factor (ECF subfamily)